MANLTPELAKCKKIIEKHAKDYGLDFFDTIFELVDYEQMHELASYSGFPIRYPHWQYGMEYEKMKKFGQYGLMRIGEMVINNDPCYAYLQESNPLWHQKMVMAHVYGHCDFFKNNTFFAGTNRTMINELANHGIKIDSHMQKFGEEKVENFLTMCLSIDDLIDYQQMDKPKSCKGKGKGKLHSHRFESKDYMDKYINPPKIIKKKQENDKTEKEKKNFERRRDILLYLLENAPLKAWQRSILSIIREESYYFAPQIGSKIMNEGWATFWHSKIMTEKGVAGSDLFEYADYHAGVIYMGNRLNPYKIGFEIFKDIEDRWNKGKFGKEWEECNDLGKKEKWDKKLGLGRKKIFEVRKTHNDVTFLTKFFTEELCNKLMLFLFEKDPEYEDVIIDTKEYKKIKDFLIFSHVNGGRPVIYLADDNYKNRKELFLKHKHWGADIDVKKAAHTLKSLQFMWKRPVHLETIIEETPAWYVHNGKECIVRLRGDKKKYQIKN